MTHSSLPSNPSHYTADNAQAERHLGAIQRAQSRMRHVERRNDRQRRGVLLQRSRHWIPEEAFEERVRSAIEAPVSL